MSFNYSQTLVFDTQANLLALQSAQVGQVAVAQDTGNEFRYTGSGWEPTSVLSYISISSPVTLALTFQVVEVINPITITLPSAALIQGRQYDIINTSNGSVTLQASSTQTIGNSNPTSTAAISAGNTLTIVSNGTNWRII